MREYIDTEILPCGCVLDRYIEGGVNVFQVAPCKMDCVNFKNALELAQEKEVPVEYRTK